MAFHVPNEPQETRSVTGVSTLSLRLQILDNRQVKIWAVLGTDEDLVGTAKLLDKGTVEWVVCNLPTVARSVLMSEVCRILSEAEPPVK